MHQYLFFIDGFPIRTYGLVLSLSIILATGVGYFLAKADRRGYEDHIVDLGIYCGVAGLIGARLWDVFFFDWDYYSHHLTELFNVWQGGMAIQGGVILGVLTGVWYCRHHHLDTVHLMDVLAPAIVLGQALGRCANLLNGDAFGAPTGSSFGIIYPDTTLAHHVYGSQPLWPAEVWEGQLDIVIFALLLLFRTTHHAKGQCFALYVMLYSAARFGLEFLRGDYTEKVLGLFTSAQTTSLAAFTIALIFFLALPLCRKDTPDRQKEIPVKARRKN
ncbi:prolipoprotein diacylglyceryl transferase [Mitsuokella sp.]|mgnify:FL=1|uniref:prolipoprotein diacylglyceryl transferase n=1 Tax=Mitsuokella TaxID=52225 RepID=UPI002A837665|nr:prolipoprotein diacylglyceryl transferase [Mitsuokella sp.]MDY4473904.1 prolipoprotein diacylglyceryl transferase [Mitsuokella sp.]